jgi:hypothetical protein
MEAEAEQARKVSERMAARRGRGRLLPSLRFLSSPSLERSRLEANWWQRVFQED